MSNATLVPPSATGATTREPEPQATPAAQPQPNMVAHVFHALNQLSALGVLGDAGPKVTGLIAIAKVANPLVTQATGKTIEQHVEEKLKKYGSGRVVQGALESFDKACGGHDGKLENFGSLSGGTQDFFKGLAGKIAAFTEQPAIAKALGTARALSSLGDMKIGGAEDATKAVALGSRSTTTQRGQESSSPNRGATIG